MHRRRAPSEALEDLMAATEVCIVCGQSEARNLGVWLVQRSRALIHADCWIAEYRAGNLLTRSERRPG